MSLRVVIAEDHKLVSEGLQTMLSFVEDIELVAVVDTGEKAVEVVTSQDVDVILMDVNFGEGLNGIEATQRIKEVKPDSHVVILSMFTDPGTVAQAIKGGASGYLSKSASREAVVAAIRDAAAGKSVLDPNVTQGIFGTIGGKGAGALTERELDVLQHLTHGKPSKKIAEDLFVSEETIKTYLKAIYRKLGAKDRAEAVAEAFRRGLVH